MMATTNARAGPDIHSSCDRLASTPAMSVSYRGTDFAASRARSSLAPASTGAA